jgi:NAD(P)-dependent dehydrogenase (short-subunit alcohol dehydrogenase family)
MDFNERIAIVTGGASGIGAATAKKLAALGATVVTWDLSEGADIRVDVSSLADVRDAMRKTLERVGAPTVLAHCAGITARSAIVDLDVDSWDKIMAVNTRGSFICVGVVANAMIEADVDQGSIVLLTSTASTLADPGMAAYATSKAGVEHFTRVAAVELGGHRIRVNSISPGPTRTPLTERTLGNESYRDLVIATTPLGELGTPEHLADAIVGTLRMDWVTGQAIIADGGTHLVTPRGAERSKISGSFKAGAAKVGA